MRSQERGRGNERHSDVEFEKERHRGSQGGTEALEPTNGPNGEGGLGLADSKNRAKRQKEERENERDQIVELKREQGVGIVVHEKVTENREMRKGTADLLARAQAELEKAKEREKQRRLREEQLSARFKAEAERARQRAKQEIALRAAGVSVTALKKSAREAAVAAGGNTEDKEDEDQDRQRFLLQVTTSRILSDQICLLHSQFACHAGCVCAHTQLRSTCMLYAPGMLSHALVMRCGSDASEYTV